MGLHIFWPASACLTLFVVGVIMILLKYGHIRSLSCRKNIPGHVYGYAVEEGHAAYERDISYSETVA